jgi:hypothetical protein
MLSYQTRLESFLLSSIEYLRNQSGVQRWCLICEDVVNLYSSFQQQVSLATLSPEDFLTLLTKPLSEIPPEVHQAFLLQLQQPEFQAYMFVDLQALVDPPTTWWQQQ